MTAAPTTAVDLTAVRAVEFPVAGCCAYFNHASDSPVPSRAARAITERVALLQDPLLEVRPREDYLRDAQARLGCLLGVPPTQIAFLTNVADATATIANGLDWRAGDEVVLVAGEFATFVYPWQNLDRLGVRSVFVPKDGAATDLDRVESALSPRTRAVAISHVEYQHGFRNDLAALGRLCRDRDLLLVVDASQSLGVYDLDMAALGVDAVVAIGYKWLMAPHGIAVLAVGESTLDRCRPTAPGRYSVAAGWETDDYALNWHPDARRYQGGALNWIGVTALAESLGLLAEVGPRAVEREAIAVADRLVAGLREGPATLTSDPRAAHRSQIVSFTLGSTETDEAFVQRALAAGVVLGRRGFGVRFGAQFWNTADEVDRLLDLTRTSR